METSLEPIRSVEIQIRFVVTPGWTKVRLKSLRLDLVLHQAGLQCV